jgi:hypothetical protein
MTMLTQDTIGPLITTATAMAKSLRRETCPYFADFSSTFGVRPAEGNRIWVSSRHWLKKRSCSDRRISLRGPTKQYCNVVGYACLTRIAEKRKAKRRRGWHLQGAGIFFRIN